LYSSAGLATSTRSRYFLAGLASPPLGSDIPGARAVDEEPAVRLRGGPRRAARYRRGGERAAIFVYEPRPEACNFFFRPLLLRSKIKRY
jgi:hypothetical protein